MDVAVFSAVMAAALFHATWNFFAKTTTSNKLSVLWLGQLVSGLGCLPFAVFFSDLSGAELQWVWFIIATGVLHAVYIALLGWSYTIGDISVVYPVARGVGIVGTCFVAIATGIDAVSDVGVTGIALIVTGIVLIGLKEIPHAAQRKVLWIATCVGMSIAAYSLLDKLAAERIPAFFYVSVLNISSAVCCAPLVLGRWRKETGEAWRSARKAVAVVGFGGIGTYVLVLWAFQFGPASYVVALRETSVMIAAGLGVFVLGERFSKRKLAGVLVVLVGAVLIRLA